MRARGGDHNAFSALVKGNTTVFLLDVQTQVVRPIATGRFGGPWSQGTGSLIQIETTSGEVRQIDIENNLGEPRAAWSPDSSRLAFAHYYPNGANPACGGECPVVIRIVGADGASRTEVSDPAGQAKGPIWSPDGAWIAYSTRQVVVIVRPDGRDAREYAQTLGGTATGWSPDGRSMTSPGPSTRPG